VSRLPRQQQQQLACQVVRSTASLTLPVHCSRSSTHARETHAVRGDSAGVPSLLRKSADVKLKWLLGSALVTELLQGSPGGGGRLAASSMKTGHNPARVHGARRDTTQCCCQHAGPSAAQHSAARRDSTRALHRARKDTTRAPHLPPPHAQMGH
jgi:hypothetical protein